MSDGNGKTREQELAEKINKKFKDDPDRFVDITELIAAARKMPNGSVAYLVNTKFTGRDYCDAKGRLTYELDKVLRLIDEKAAKQKSIVVPKVSPPQQRRF